MHSYVYSMVAVAAGYRKAWSVLGDSAWWLLQLAIEMAWSALDYLFFCFLVQSSVENGPFTL